jgi:hypothetical protein
VRLGCPGDRADHPLLDGQQRRVLVPGPGRVPRMPGVAGEFVAGGQSVRVLLAEHPLTDGQQRRELVPRPGRVPRLPGEAGELVAGFDIARIASFPL